MLTVEGARVQARGHVERGVPLRVLKRLGWAAHTVRLAVVCNKLLLLPPLNWNLSVLFLTCDR